MIFAQGCKRSCTYRNKDAIFSGCKVSETIKIMAQEKVCMSLMMLFLLWCYFSCQVLEDFAFIISYNYYGVNQSIFYFIFLKTNLATTDNWKVFSLALLPFIGMCKKAVCCSTSATSFFFPGFHYIFAQFFFIKYSNP